MVLAADHLADLFQALLAEEKARDEVRAAVHRQAVALRELRRLGLPPSVVAQKVATARGLVLGLPDRLRLAERLRKRRWRGTRCPSEVVLSHGPPPSSITPLDRASPPDHQEATMAKLVKRTITEEFIETKKPDEDEDQEVEEDVDESDDVEEEPEGDAEPPRKRRRR
jgi:hypothetical protein